jgi:putative ABC transport system permease protein
MLANYVAAALRNFTRNGLYAGVTVFGLAIAFAAAILISLFVRDEYSYDRFVPGYEQVYRIVETVHLPGGQTLRLNATPQSQLADDLRLSFGGVQSVARLAWEAAAVQGRPGDPVVAEPAFGWADPDFFKVLPLPAIAGDPTSALEVPDGVAMTRSAARRYFGGDAPIGQTLQVDGHPMRVMAVLRDLPSNTHLFTEVFASARAPFASGVTDDRSGWAPSTYVRLRVGVRPAELDRALAQLAHAYSSHTAAYRTSYDIIAVPLSRLHLAPSRMDAPPSKPSGDPRAIDAIALVGGLIVLVAGVNFVTLMTARSARRAVEVGVRKVAGAGRSDLMVQFMGEALTLVAVAMLAAVAMAELLLKPMNAVLQRRIVFDYASDPSVAAALAGATLAIGLLAGLYPALILASFRPVEAFKGRVVRATVSTLAREAMVAVQFAIFIGLVVVAATIWRQTNLALHEGLAAQKSQILLVTTPCGDALRKEVAALPGVGAAACSSEAGGTSIGSVGESPVQTPRGALEFVMAPVDFGFLDLYGLKPLAGRLFDRQHGEDGVLRQVDTLAQPSVIINQSAVRALGFATPAAAIGQSMTWKRFSSSLPAPLVASSPIVGVVEDTHTSVREPPKPTFYYIDPPKDTLLSLRIDGDDASATTQALRKLWTRMVDRPPLQTRFLAQLRLQQYQDIVLEGAVIGIGSGLAMIIASLGLFALSAYIAERRTKEFGVRKAMGASSADILMLSLWQFARPVLAAALVAWPIAFLAMRWWLQGFAYHVDQTPLTSVTAALAAMVIGMGTAAGQSYKTARMKPVIALRYE